MSSNKTLSSKQPLYFRIYSRDVTPRYVYCKVILDISIPIFRATPNPISNLR